MDTYQTNCYTVCCGQEQNCTSGKKAVSIKTIHRSQGDTEKRIVVNFNTRKAIPHIHYVELSRVTAIEGLYITDPCENKIAVSNAVCEEMARLRNDGKLSFCVSPVYKADQISFKLYFLNARSLHKHIDAVRKDLNYSSTDVNIFAETGYARSDNNDIILCH